MRILKIALRNYRGVRDRTVEFASTGVTIVEGPNEIGKSSIAESIDRIIEDLDSTSRQRVQAIKPVDRDAGPEVTIEVESGSYAFRYKKRFLRDRVTELEIYRPRPENYTGREAHDRVQAILGETVDMALWKALRMLQGDVVGQAALTEQTALSAALDRSAGESPAGDEEVTLFDLAHAEYLQYWTETGRRKQAVVNMEREIADATQRITGLEEGIRAIEADTEASVRLEAEVQRLAERGVEQRSKLNERQARVDALAQLEAGVDTIEAKFEAGRLAANEARRVDRARQDAISRIAAARTAHEELVSSDREGGPQIEASRERVESADATVAESRKKREAAAAVALRRQARLTQLRDLADLSSLLDRRDRVRVAIAALEAAASDAALPIDASALAGIKEQHRTVELARARLEASRPLVHLDAMADLVGIVDGVAVNLPAGSAFEQRVEQSLEFAVPDVASLSVAVGAAGDMTSTELQAAEAQLESLLRAAGASDLPDAERRHRLREDAVRAVAEQQRVLKDNLGDLPQEGLQEQIAALRGRTKGAETDDVVANDLDEDEVGRSVVEAQRALAMAAEEMYVAESEWQAAHERHAELEVARTERTTEICLMAEDLNRRETALAEERSAATDESVARSLRTAEGVEEALSKKLGDAREELAREGPDQARELLANAIQAMERVDADTRQVQDELLAGDDAATCPWRGRARRGAAGGSRGEGSGRPRVASLPGPRGGPETALRDAEDGAGGGPAELRRAASARDREPRQDRVRPGFCRRAGRLGPLGCKPHHRRPDDSLQEPQCRRAGTDCADLEARLRHDRCSRRRCPDHPGRRTWQLRSAAP